jgi:hypothetical protein
VYGYIYKFDIYTGKNAGTSAAKKEFGLGGSVVKDLSSHLEGKKHKIFFDNYFASIPLME